MVHDIYYVDPTDWEPEKEINYPLLEEEAIATFGGTYLLAVNETEDTPGVKRVKFSFEEGHGPGLTACWDLVDDHDASLMLIGQYIEEQKSTARTAARDGLYDWRDKAPAVMWALVTAQKLADLESEMPTLETGADAVNYWTGKQEECEDERKLYADTGTTSYRDRAVEIRTRMDRAIFNTILLVSEWDANGSDVS